MGLNETEVERGVEGRTEPVVRPGALSPNTAFKTLGNETRLAILDVLWNPRESAGKTFTELRKAIGMRDGSQFNFHLKKLVDGGFVRKVDSRYSIRQAGARVICTVRTGYLTDHPELPPFETGGQCSACDAALSARYADGMFFVECSACGTHQVRMWFPPNGLIGRTPEEALLAADYAMRAAIDLASAGICPVCNGSTERTLSRRPSEIPIKSAYAEPEHDGVLVAWFICGHCGAWITASPGDAVLDHPAVVALYSEHGIDIRACPRWELPWTVDTAAYETVADDPLQIRLTVTVEDEDLVLTLDEAFEVLSVD
jgi:DNA-binding transcriptional ArsR family regulator/Zn ribbon nucleic-acid-binding protein